ncbi:thiamine pyrophosphate-binding protein [Salipiger sp. P9]|uniref:thiamine pyrophosphate-binding protein n=1 Tax=Salipiger pentaromativorans TaxID=2943193 RepID=UPI002158444D|nr:thiamine pyrophosphate-binding protein [Salipiger pentaromativorans]MCR8547491.1 thiamine pyrophosphate-binding protein [Salipiger pentaromativorans]
MSSKTTHEILAQSLAAHEVRHLFGLVGDANLFLVDAFQRGNSGQYVACHHESNAVLAALGYAQVSGRVGVATITHGPALTNVVTALVEGVRGCIPMVLLCGDTPPGDLEHLQRIGQREVVAATGAGFVEMRSPETAATDLARAFRQAALERRPVVFNMRVDLMWQPAPEAAPAVLSPPALRHQVAEDESFDEAMGMIASARRPLILAGRGAASPEAREALLALAERLEAPVATTLKAQGLFHGAPFDLGVFGGLSTPLAVDEIQKSDCIVAFGASLSRQTTESGAFTAGRRVVQILPDARENGRRTEPTLLLVGDPVLTARRMVELLDLVEIPPSGNTDADLSYRLARQREEQAALPAFAATAPGTVDYLPAMRRLDRALPPDRVLVTDLGRFVSTAWRCLPVTAPEALVYTAHFGSIGLGLAEALGAAHAAGGKTTVLVAGDGGFMLGGVGELASALRDGLDLVVILCNDGSYGAEHVQFTNRAMNPALSMTAPPDFTAMARALGAEAVCVTGPEALADAEALIANRRGPVLIELRLDPDNIPAS